MPSELSPGLSSNRRPFSGSPPRITVVGAGLAGTECALQLADRGHLVTLIEMRGMESTPAHKTADCGELVCSNSFGSLAHHAAPGLLKWEAERAGSRVLQAALDARVPAGQALGIDRERFAQALTDAVESHTRIQLERRVIRTLDEIPRPAVVATGPLTHDDLARSFQAHFGEADHLYFFDAIAPIVAADSINEKIAWKADRWDKGTKDYWNCPMSKKEYYFFIEAVREAKKIEAKDFEKNTPYFESCMPIEAILERGPLTLRFGPMSAKGLRDPRTGNMPFACVQLRQDNREGTAYNMVGFQTKMAYADQKRVFRLIPGLEEAEFLKLGSIHRNLYINTPKLLARDLSSKRDPWLFFAGQITGVEGYFESTCMGLLVSHFLDAKLRGVETLVPPRESAFGSLHAAITDETKMSHFQPTNINFGHLPEPRAEELQNPRDKAAKRELQIAKAKRAFSAWCADLHLRQIENSRVEAAADELLALSEATPS